MEKEITWLSHGGPGSGRYPKGSGKKYLKKSNKLRKENAKIWYKSFKSKNEEQRKKLDEKYAENFDSYVKIDQFITSKLNIPLKTVRKSTTIGYNVLSGPKKMGYDKIKIDKKALKGKKQAESIKYNPFMP